MNYYGADDNDCKMKNKLEENVKVKNPLLGQAAHFGNTVYLSTVCVCVC